MCTMEEDPPTPSYPCYICDAGKGCGECGWCENSVCAECSVNSDRHKTVHTFITTKQWRLLCLECKWDVEATPEYAAYALSQLPPAAAPAAAPWSAWDDVLLYPVTNEFTDHRWQPRMYAGWLQTHNPDLYARALNLEAHTAEGGLHATCCSGDTDILCAKCEQPVCNNCADFKVRAFFTGVDVPECFDCWFHRPEIDKLVYMLHRLHAGEHDEQKYDIRYYTDMHNINMLRDMRAAFVHDVRTFSIRVAEWELCTSKISRARDVFNAAKLIACSMTRCTMTGNTLCTLCDCELLCTVHADTNSVEAMFLKSIGAGDQHVLCDGCAVVVRQQPIWPIWQTLSAAYDTSETRMEHIVPTVRYVLGGYARKTIKDELMRLFVPYEMVPFIGIREDQTCPCTFTLNTQRLEFISGTCQFTSDEDGDKMDVDQPTPLEPNGYNSVICGFCPTPTCRRHGMRLHNVFAAMIWGKRETCRDVGLPVTMCDACIRKCVIDTAAAAEVTTFWDCVVISHNWSKSAFNAGEDVRAVLDECINDYGIRLERLKKTFYYKLFRDPYVYTSDATSRVRARIDGGSGLMCPVCFAVEAVEAGGTSGDPGDVESMEESAAPMEAAGPRTAEKNTPCSKCRTCSI